MKRKKFWRDFGEGPQLFDVLENNVGKHIIVFDTETTGLSPEYDTIIQISAIKMMIEENHQLAEVDRLDMYINPGRKLDKVIVQLTGITDERLANEPKEDEAWPTIRDFFASTNLVGGHNAAKFDMSMLRALYKRHNEDKEDWLCVDTMRMAQELYLKEEVGNFKLGNLAEHFGVNFGLTFHNSMDDVIATVRLLRYFIDEYEEKKAETPVEPVKQKARVKSCWAWTGYRGMQRLYVRLTLEERVLWMNQRRPYNWGEKDAGTLDMVDMEDIEQQVLTLYKCNSLEELSKVRESKYAFAR